MSIYKELKDRKLTASDKLIFLFLSENKNSTYVEICQQLELSINTVKAGLKKLVKNNLIERNRSGNLHSTKIVPCFIAENRTQHKFCTMYEYKNYHSTNFVPCYNSDYYLLKSNSYAMAWYKNCTMLWELERKEAKERYIYINTYINSININIISIEGKSSLTTFASTSLKYYIGKFDFVNDLDHRNINQIQNSLTPTEPAKTSLAEIAKAPATQKKPRKTKAPFQPPTYDMVLGFMAAYVHQEQNNFPELIEINLNIEAKKYMNFYSGKDWRLGVIRMTDWRIQASNWLMGKVERITEGKIKIKKNQQYIQEAFGDSFLNSQNIVDLNQVQNADGTITAETPAIQTSFPVFQQTKTKEQLKKETDDFIQKHKSGEVL